METASSSRGWVAIEGGLAHYRDTPLIPFSWNQRSRWRRSSSSRADASCDTPLEVEATTGVLLRAEAAVREVVFVEAFCVLALLFAT